MLLCDFFSPLVFWRTDCGRARFGLV